MSLFVFRGILAPMLLYRPPPNTGQLSPSPASNFWPAIRGYTGFFHLPAFKDSVDYDHIVSRRRRNYWAVPCVFSAILIASWKFNVVSDALASAKHADEVDRAFCRHCLRSVRISSIPTIRLEDSCTATHYISR